MTVLYRYCIVTLFEHVHFREEALNATTTYQIGPLGVISYNGSTWVDLQDTSQPLICYFLDTTTVHDFMSVRWPRQNDDEFLVVLTHLHERSDGVVLQTESKLHVTAATLKVLRYHTAAA